MIFFIFPDNRKMIQNPPKPRNDTAVVKRVLSANRNKVNTLQNLILELQSEINHLRVENRDLKRSSRIQEKVIKKLDDEEAEIPVLIRKHNSEVSIIVPLKCKPNLLYATVSRNGTIEHTVQFVCSSPTVGPKYFKKPSCK